MTANTEPQHQEPSESLIQQYYSPVEIASMLGLRVRTVTNYLKNPDHPLKGVKIQVNQWRVPRASLEAFLKGLYGNADSKSS